MAALFKDSGLEGLKGSIQYCADCGKPTIHYRAQHGWAICYACGFNPDLERLAAEADRLHWRDMASEIQRTQRKAS